MGILLIILGFYFVLQDHPILGLIFAIIGGYILESVLRDIDIAEPVVSEHQREPVMRTQKRLPDRMLRRLRTVY